MKVTERTRGGGSGAPYLVTMGSNNFKSMAATILSMMWCSQSLSIRSHTRMIDLRSDTVTKPTAAMRTAMFDAEVGDDVFGDDPTVHLLENKLSLMFEKESALFFPTGTMSNLAATMSWCGTRGSEIILGDSSHMFLYEQGGVSQLAGVLPRTIMNERDGTINIDSIDKAVRQSNIHFPVTELIALEDTHNFCGGRVLPKGYLDAVSTVAKSRNIAVHLDGARIWNAAAYSKMTLAELTKGADSISVCLSKGLGAPSGSVLLGPSVFIEKARRCRKALGGGMRQVGILAAAGLEGVKDFEAGLLLADHSKARLLANAIAAVTGFSIALDAVETNIVLVDVGINGPGPAIIAGMLKERGILALPFGINSVRLVTHRDIMDDDIEVVASAFKDIAIAIWPALFTGTESYVSNVSAIPTENTAAVQVMPVQSDRVDKELDPVLKNVSTRRLITKVLQNEDIFRPDLTMTEKKFIVDAAQGIKVLPGDVVIRMGDSAEFFYVIESGRVDFYLDLTGEYLNAVKTLSTGGFFGEIALMYDAPRAATVIAATETILWRIHKNDFFSIQKAPDNKLGFFKASSYVEGEEDSDSLDDIEEVDESVEEKIEAVVADIIESTGRLSVTAAKEEALRTAGDVEEPLAIFGMEVTEDVDDELFVVGGPETFETWEEEELQGLESGGQAVSLTEDEYEEEEVVQEEELILESEVTTESSDNDSTEYYEEAVIHGMSLSDDGFCVLLKGVVCDRVLRVLVTPSDPMSDGLDIDQVETSEAVTLLQLLQGIDVESILARDALAVKFAEAGPGKQQYVLQRVLVDGVSTSKTFHARLLGTALSSSATQAAAQQSHIIVPLPVSVVPQHNFDHPVFETLPHASHLPEPLNSAVTAEIDVYPPEPAPQVLPSLLQPGVLLADIPLDTPMERNLLSDGRATERKVEVNSAFEAIALALRHSAVVEVRSSLLQDEHFSYSLEELPSFFPKLVESGISADEHGRFGVDYDSKNEMERLQRRLFEAIRQGNSVKIDSIKRQLEFYSHIEGRSVLVLPPPALFLAPDIVPTSVNDQLIVDISQESAEIVPEPCCETSLTSLETLKSCEILKAEEELLEVKVEVEVVAEPVKRSLFDAFTLPFQFDSQKREQKELEEEQLDQLDQLTQKQLNGLDMTLEEQTEAAEGTDSEEDSDDGLGRQLKSMYLEEEEKIELDNWNLQ